MKTTATTEAVSSPPEEKWHLSQQWRQNTFRAGQKPRSDWKNDLQTYEEGRKSRKPPTPFEGIKPYGKSQFRSTEWSESGDAIVETARLALPS
jgi:hypothetical protein